ncbi:MAG: 30S ribosomal protein S9 [Promethearchaeota archaeon]
MEKNFREYDDSLLSGDSRRTEPKKFGGKKARSRRQKSFR